MALLLAPLRRLTSSIIRLAILAGILLVAYLVLLKPAIDSGEKQVRQTLHSLERKASPKRLAHCISRADGDVDRMKRCARLF
jgi:cell division protein ZapA (FtsZ GTPase activity inhibitor)